MNTGTKIAVDIAILPPEEVAEKLISINKEAIHKTLAWGPLGKDDFLPHMSLAMGCVKSNNIEAIKNVIEEITKKFTPITIELNELYYAQKEDGSKVYCIRAKNTPALQGLHKNLSNALDKHFSYDCTKETLYSKAGEKTVEPGYINRFHSSRSFEAFDPHITIRTKKEFGQDALPITFTATTVAICHAGIMTTCRKKLFSVELTD